jgi:hypothetical protein
VVSNGQSVSLTDVIVDGIVVNGGGSVTATNVRVNGSVVVLPQVGAPMTKLHLTDSAVTNGLTINVVDSAGSLHWATEVPVDVVVSGSWVNHPQGNGDYHTEALAGFGMPRGAKFYNSSFIQQGPFNGTATGTTNWHGADTIMDGNHFGWEGSPAAYYTVYVEGRNNVVRNSTFDKGLADYIYPNSSPKATYTNNQYR